MKKTFNILTVCGIAATALLLVSCKEDKLTTFPSDNDNIYFSTKQYPNQWDIKVVFDNKEYTYYTPISISETIDELEFSFFMLHSSVVKDTIFIPITLVGNPSDKDRTVVVKDITDPQLIENEPGYKGPIAADPGADFNILHAFIPANKTKGGVFIELKRANLKNGVEKYLDIELDPNDNFKTQLRYISKSSTNPEQVSMLTYRILMNDKVSKPAGWLDSVFGLFSAKKMQVLLYDVGVPESILYTIQSDIADLYAWAGVFNRYLETQRLNGTPILEEDNSPMVGGTWGS